MPGTITAALASIPSSIQAGEEPGNETSVAIPSRFIVGLNHLLPTLFKEV